MSNVESISPSRPDILEVIANLSSNEVFTPPRVANSLLDLLPQSVWKDPNLRWLDPGCKSGVFLREITKRLMRGLADWLPDESARLEHILRKMVFGIAITDITAMMSRRSLYCSVDAASTFSAVNLPNSDGNIWYRRVEHVFDEKGRCMECRGTRVQLERVGRDNHAYGFIHREGQDSIAREFGDMKFDVIVGNPPYQMDADSEGQNVVPLYDAFVQQAISLNPQHVLMIIPSRWMVGGKSLDNFRDVMLRDRRINRIVDFAEMADVFPGVDFEGGVCYFMWSRDHEGQCAHSFSYKGHESDVMLRDLAEYDVFVRDSRALPILRKVLACNETSLSEFVSVRDPFGSHFTSSFRGYRRGNRQPTDIAVITTESGKRIEKFVEPDQITRNFEHVRKWKLLVPKAYGERGKMPARVLGPLMIAPPRTACNISFLYVGPVANKNECENLQSYLETRFVRFLISLRKVTQNVTQSTFTWVPVQDWGQAWTDDDLYDKYEITGAEREFIESVIKEVAV